MGLPGTKRNVTLSMSSIGSPHGERSMSCGIGRNVFNSKKGVEGQREVYRWLETEVIRNINAFAKSDNKLRGEIERRNLAQEGSLAEPITGSGRILFMDDEEVIRELMVQMLSLLGYEVVPARDGQEAVNLYNCAKGSSQAFDAVIMDLTVPGGLGGKEAVQLLREADPSVRAILSSGSSNDVVMADYKKYGFKAAVTKPYTVEELSRVLKEVLAPDRY
jgi:CheY-like chemotaxis protein